MARWLARLLLTLFFAGSLAATLWSARELLRNPALVPIVERSGSEIAAATERALARAATVESLSAKLTERLSDEPRDWRVIGALQDVAAERGLALPPALLAQIEAQSQADASPLYRTKRCAACFIDIVQCGLEEALVCKVPLMLTPVDDLRGVTQAGVDWAQGEEIDKIDLGLSAVGLAATGAILLSGGSSASVKGGTALLKTARGMKLIRPSLLDEMAETARAGIDLAALPSLRGSDDLARVLKAEKLAPLTGLAADALRSARAVGPTDSLRLLKAAGSTTDARRLANAAEALGPKAVGRLEVLGPARFLKLTTRLSDLALTMISGLVGLMLSLASLLGHGLSTALLRGLERSARSRT